MKKPTSEEVQAEIARLKELKPKVLRRSVFGDDHHAAIDAQVEFLEGNLDNTTDEFYDEPENVQCAVGDAENWRDGDTDEVPSEWWKDLIKK